MGWQGRRQHVGVPGHLVRGGPGHRWAFEHRKEKYGSHDFRDGRWEPEADRLREERREEPRDYW